MEERGERFTFYQNREIDTARIVSYRADSRIAPMRIAHRVSEPTNPTAIGMPPLTVCLH